MYQLLCALFLELAKIYLAIQAPLVIHKIAYLPPVALLLCITYIERVFSSVNK